MSTPEDPAPTVGVGDPTLQRGAGRATVPKRERVVRWRCGREIAGRDGRSALRASSLGDMSCRPMPRGPTRSRGAQPVALTAPTPRRERRTRYVVLGMLLQGPANGYEVRQRIATSVGNFWQESFGQLYPTLHQLLREDLVERSDATPGPREGQRYAITGTGRQALRAWLARPPRPQPERNELLLKVFFAELAPDEVRDHVVRAGAAASDDARRLAALETAVTARLADHPALPAWLATLDYGRIGNQLLDEWASRTAARLTAMATARPAAAPRTRRRSR